MPPGTELFIPGCREAKPGVMDGMTLFGTSPGRDKTVMNDIDMEEIQFFVACKILSCHKIGIDKTILYLWESDKPIKGMQ